MSRIQIRENNGRLQLRWTHNGQRRSLNIGSPDEVGWLAARLKAAEIERDLMLGNYDPTLTRYRNNTHPDGLPPLDLFDRWYEHKSKLVDKRTLEKYRTLRNRLKEFVEQRGRQRFQPADFKNFLLERIKPVTVNDRLATLRECWKWGISQGLTKENIWLDLKERVPPKQPQPLTLEELGRIRDEFKRDQYCRHYCDYLDFLMGTGCRTGEAVGLLWRHVAPDFSSVWIGEIWTKGERKPEKRNRGRTVPLTPTLRELLKGRYLGNPDEFVFTGPRGEPIHVHNFTRRIWAPALKRLGIPYRKPYVTRSTLISHAIDAGMNPVEIAELTGHNVQTLHRHYAGILRRPQLPDILGQQKTAHQ